MQKRILFTLLVYLHFFAPYAQSQELIFQSGFESNTQMDNENADDVDIIGVDESVASPNDWVGDLEGHSNIGYFRIQYQGGDTGQRQAEIITDPTDGSNKVLHYWIKEPNISGAGRIQANVYENTNYTNVYFKARLYLPHDFNIIKEADFRTRWLTLMEFWNDAFWDEEEHPFRIGVSLQKLTSTEPDSLHFSVHSQTRNLDTEDWDNDVWEYTNLDYDVPIGKWMTIEINFIEGDACNGHFYMTVTPDGESKVVVHDIQDYTHHPTDPDPDGLGDFNPLKLYTSDDLVNYITDEGGLLQVYWDDFELWKDKTEATIFPCDPIKRHPYLQAAASDRATIKWSTRDATDSKVWYGDAPGNLNMEITIPGNVTEHEIEITGLSANTIYYYAVGDDNGQMAGADSEHYFKTSPGAGSGETIRAWILGDPGMRNDEQRLVRDGYLDYIGANPTDLMLLLGNNAYKDGTNLEFQMALFENMYEDQLRNTFLWATYGEEEDSSSDSGTESGPYYDIFNFPIDGSSGGTASNTEAWYSFDYGNIHFVMLNSVDVDRTSGGAILTWLENDLTNTAQEWIVAAFHHAPYTGTDNNSSDVQVNAKDMRENALPILEAGGVDLVLGGYTHNYQRSYLVNGHYGISSTFDVELMGLDRGDGKSDGDAAYLKAIDGPADGAGAVYMVAGSSGQASQATGEYPTMFHRAQKLGSVALEVTGLQMDVRFIDENGEVEDYFTIIKQHEPPIVDIVAPQNEAYYESPQMVTLETNAFDSNGSIVSVEFFANNVSIGTDTDAPYSLNWTIPSDGIYVIKAEATDNDGNIGRDIIRIGAGNLAVCKTIVNSSDDVEEFDDGDMKLTSGDLELANDGASALKIGMRFTGLQIPQGATINSAYIQFTSDDTANENPCNLDISGEANDNAVTFLSTDFDVSNRSKTSAEISWSPPDWTVKHEAGPDEKTPDLASIVQEIVNRTGYTANSALTFFVEGTGRRSADSFDGGLGEEPILCIEYVPPVPLPVELLHFSAKEKENRQVLLEWGTASEKNNKQYVIERSLDGQHFDMIGIVSGKGTTNLLQQYEFVDQAPLPINYYRLKQVDYDGSYAFSKIAVVELSYSEDTKLLVYPSSAEKEINIRFTSFETPKSLLKIVNGFGELLYEEMVTSSQKVENRKIDLADYEPGLYHISLTDGTQFITTKFVVTKLY